MFTFLPGEQRTASVEMSNPTASPFDYEATLFIGVNAITSAVQSFQLAAGESQTIQFTITMPSIPGTYPVYIAVSSGGLSIALYQSVEDIVISIPLFQITLANPPAAATHWFISLIPWSGSGGIDSGELTINQTAVLTVPTSWLWPLKFYIFAHHYVSGSMVMDYQGQSQVESLPYFLAEFIPALGNYYFNVSTQQFELV